MKTVDITFARLRKKNSLFSFISYPLYKCKYILYCPTVINSFMYSKTLKILL